MSQMRPALDASWPFWPVVPLYPYGKRRTVRREAVKDTIWTFDQQQGIFYVVVPIRMTVVRLDKGGLLVYAPVAPTEECVAMVRELEGEHGPVRYIVLPTVSAIEHKAFVGPFARKFPEAQVYVIPNQWSFPVNLPLSWLGFPPKRTHTLPEDSAESPFQDDFDYALLGPVRLGLGSFEEVAFFHRASGTLLVTDTLMAIPETPPEIVSLDPYPLLFHARESASDPIVDTPENRIKGWRRIVLFTFYFRPAVLAVPGLGEVLRDAPRASDRSKRGYFGLFPFRWRADWLDSYKALYRDGQLFVAPVLQLLILNRNPAEVRRWVDQVTCWDIQRVMPAHLASPVAATAAAVRRAFEFVDHGSELPAGDLETIQELNQDLTRLGAIPPVSQ
ncbi:MAG: DUF4336 domain-containing protein [Cyanobacteria bacterium P01_A01_bin.135]